MGMNCPGIDNRQMALNIMHWLSGLLEPREARRQEGGIERGTLAISTRRRPRDSLLRPAAAIALRTAGGADCHEPRPLPSCIRRSISDTCRTVWCADGFLDL